jgi:hypothetical protein
MTPHDVHYGLAKEKWNRRAQALAAKYAAHPERFPNGVPAPPPLLQLVVRTRSRSAGRPDGLFRTAR